jgi:adenylate cyclase
MRMADPEDVFVSYSRQDNDKVQELTTKLCSAGVGMWMDVRNIDGAAMWGEEIVNAVAKSKVLLLLVSKSSVVSQNVVKEVLLASERKGHILPVDLEHTEIPGSLKYALLGIQHIEYFRGDADEHMKSIIRSLERLGVAVGAPQASPPPCLGPRHAIPKAIRSGVHRAPKGSLSRKPAMLALSTLLRPCAAKASRR